MIIDYIDPKVYVRVSKDLRYLLFYRYIDLEFIPTINKFDIKTVINLCGKIIYT